MPARSLRKPFSRSQIKAWKDQVDGRRRPYLESERVLIVDGKNGPDKSNLINEIIRHIHDSPDIFVTCDQPGVAPVLPPGISAEFVPPIQITAPRQRIYFMDLECRLRKICEVRQELRPDGMYKQTVKTGNGATKADSTMDRYEQASTLLASGFNICAIRDKETRDAILDGLISLPKPVLRIISQRTRVSYYPKGDRSTVVEVALEPVLIGQTFTGFIWQEPKIDLEIKKGPEEREARHEILRREEERLMELFPLKKQLRSTPSPGLDKVAEALRTSSIHRKVLRMMELDAQWWLGLGQEMREQRPAIALTA